MLIQLLSLWLIHNLDEDANTSKEVCIMRPHLSSHVGPWPTPRAIMCEHSGIVTTWKEPLPRPDPRERLWYNWKTEHYTNIMKNTMITVIIWSEPECTMVPYGTPIWFFWGFAIGKILLSNDFEPYLATRLSYCFSAETVNRSKWPSEVMREP